MVITLVIVASISIIIIITTIVVVVIFRHCPPGGVSSPVTIKSACQLCYHHPQTITSLAVLMTIPHRYMKGLGFLKGILKGFLLKGFGGLGFLFRVL